MLCFDCAMLRLELMSVDRFPVFHECPAWKAVSCLQLADFWQSRL